MRLILSALALATFCSAADAPFMTKEDIFPLNAEHNHASAIVRLPNGDLLTCWYRGSGERTADDVRIMGARKAKGAKAWSEPFVLADVPGFPDTNPMLWVDGNKRLWLFWQTIVANQWETAITQWKVSDKYTAAGVPLWADAGILMLKPVRMAERVAAWLPTVSALATTDREMAYIKNLQKMSEDKYASRMGWMTRAHATQLPSGRILLPLYSDGFSFSLVAISDDGGKTWHSSEPIVGAGNIQPTIVPRKDGSLVAYMRDNGPPPKRVLWSESKDNGETWSFAADTEIPNSGTGLEAIKLKDGRWLMINNDTERGRSSLALTISDDEGKTWKWTRHLELEPNTPKSARFHYPSITEAPDGIHASYSYFKEDAKPGEPRKTIRHAHFNLAWVEQGDGAK